MDRRFLSTEEVAEIFGVKPEQLRDLIRRGDCPPASIRDGQKGQRWRAKLVEDWVIASERKAFAAVAAERC